MGDEPLDEVGLHYQVFHCHSLEEHQVLIIHDDGDLNWLLRPLQQLQRLLLPKMEIEKGVEDDADGKPVLSLLLLRQQAILEMEFLQW